MKITEDLHGALVRAGAKFYSSVRQKPLSIDLALPLPPRLRVYSGALRLGLRNQVKGPDGRCVRHRYAVVGGQLRQDRRPP
jgi:hypothetical protein